MAEFDFPESRFSEADATPAENEQLRGEFLSSDTTIQRSFGEFWSSVSTAGLRDYLFTLRKEGHFTSQPAASSENVPDDVFSAPSASDVLTTTKDDESESDASGAEQ